MHLYQPSLQDPDAFSILYERTHIIIFRFIYGMHGGPVEEVEDLTCDTFLRAWKGRNRFNGDEHDALCWLFTIARRLVIDAYRYKKVRRKELVVSLDDSNFEFIRTPNQASPEERAVIQEQFKCLWQLVQNLPIDRREMLVLRYMLGWKVKEIASYLRRDENTISVYIKRCLVQLRQEWPSEEVRR